MGIHSETASLHHIRKKSIFCFLMMSLLSDVTMQLSLWYHKPSLWYLLSLSKNISSHFMSWNWHKHNKEGGGIFIIFINTISVLLSLFSFNSLTVHHKKLPCVILTKKWPLSNIFTSTSSLCFYVLIVYLSGFFFFFCVCVCV